MHLEAIESTKSYVINLSINDEFTRLKVMNFLSYVISTVTPSIEDTNLNFIDQTVDTRDVHHHIFSHGVIN